MKMTYLNAFTEYRTWVMMKYRCLNPKCTDYINYGGRGIKVCDEWLNSFECFYNDMGKKPLGFTIDRIDVNGNYEKTNCRWLSRSDNSKNRRKKNNQYNTERENEMVTSKNLKKILPILNVSQLARESNIKPATLINKINKETDLTTTESNNIAITLYKYFDLFGVEMIGKK